MNNDDMIPEEGTTEEVPAAFLFDGFDPANTTPVPDVFFDVLLPMLSKAQLCVLLYIIRRTLGFKKPSDAISLNQFRYGIKTKDGRQLDNGCGLKNMNAISKAAKDLEKMGIIQRDKGNDPAGDPTTTRYTIRFRSQGGTTQRVVPTTQRGVPTTPGVVGGTTRSVGHGTTRSVGGVLRGEYGQETVIQETVIQETVGLRGGDNTPPSPALISLSDFMFLDDPIRPTRLTVLLTPEPYSSEIEDKRRAWAAQEVKERLAELGHTVAYQWVTPKDAPIIEGSVQNGQNQAQDGQEVAQAQTGGQATGSAGKKAARTRKKAVTAEATQEGSQDQAAKPARRTPSRSVEKKEKPDYLAQASDRARAVILEWLGIFTDDRPVTKTLLENAEALAAYNPQPGEIRACRDWQYATDTKNWYRTRGHHLGDVLREFEKFRSLKTAPTPTPGGGPGAGGQAPQDGQTSQEELAAVRERNQKTLEKIHQRRAARAAQGSGAPALPVR